ncbi:helix-hairpin-helix domain-containing protein [Nonlabens antarcticus]|uniref:helix-hairpin-helix domain-containing protein n=1 Tax=Nonlabens antarcticus TaxID=392714 RepID=UPI0018911C7A|nr:helix-hairpin-helix domain-containing protein [Nonlabens antarcticus]
MKNLKSLFLFDKRQQRGILLLMLLLVIVCGLRYYASTIPDDRLLLTDVSEYQEKIDSLKRIAYRKKDTIYPFNPNYINDYRAYQIGLNEEELLRLNRFRESGTFINSPAQFQQVTEVSKQWLDSISPYFKFPAWVNNPKTKSKSYTSYKDRKIVISNINTASREQLKEVYGIGPALSGRILEERIKLNGFIAMEQVLDVYGITDSTMLEVKKHFFIKPPQGFKKHKLNTSTRDELSTIPYFNDYLIDELIEQRTLRDGFKSWDKVLLTSRFPQEKLSLIQLYLTLN